MIGGLPLAHAAPLFERTYQGERQSSLAEMAEAVAAWCSTLGKWLGIANKTCRKRRRG